MDADPPQTGVNIPRLFTVRVSTALRTRIENAIEHLVILLDAIDGDPDLEDGADAEPIDERELEDEGDVLDHGEADHG